MTSMEEMHHVIFFQVNIKKNCPHILASCTPNEWKYLSTMFRAKHKESKKKRPLYIHYIISQWKAPNSWTRTLAHVGLSQLDDHHLLSRKLARTQIYIISVGRYVKKYTLKWDAPILSSTYILTSDVLPFVSDALHTYKCFSLNLFSSIALHSVSEVDRSNCLLLRHSNSIFSALCVAFTSRSFSHIPLYKWVGEWVSESTDTFFLWKRFRFFPLSALKPCTPLTLLHSKP